MRGRTETLQRVVVENPAHTRRSALAQSRDLVGLSIPIVVGLAGHSLLSVIDSWMLAPLGEIPLAAASLAQSLLLVMYSGLYGFAGPVAILAAEARGKGDAKRQRAVLTIGSTLALCAGLTATVLMAVLLPALPSLGQPEAVIAALPMYWLVTAATLPLFALTMAIKLYMEATDAAWQAAALCMIPAIVSVPAHLIFVFGWQGIPALGLLGSAIANFLALLVGLVAMFAYVRLRARRQVQPSDNQTADKQSRRYLLRDGLIMASQYIAEGGAVTVTGIMIGLLGALALAANQIATSVAVLAFMAPLGLSAAASIQFASCLGRGQRDELKSLAWVTLALVIVLMSALAAAFGFFAWPLAGLFTTDIGLIELTATLFIAIAFLQIFDGIQSVSLGALRGLFDNTYASVVSLVCYWLVALPLAYAFGFLMGWGAAGIWFGFGVGLAIAAMILVRRLFAVIRRVATNTEPLIHE